MDQNRLDVLSVKLGLGRVHYAASLPSTNILAMEWAAGGCLNKSLIVADEQTRGKGRSGRQWHTIPGSSLAMSLILNRFDYLTDPSHFIGLSGLAVALALEEFTQSPVSIKWPNDILIDRKKIAGILVESQWEGETLKSIVIGIGVNLTPASLSFPEHPRVPATYLEAYANKPHARSDLLESIVRQILKWAELGRPDMLFPAWNERLAYRGEKIRATRSENDQINGILQGVSDSGKVIILLENNTSVQFDANEIRAISTAPGKETP